MILIDAEGTKFDPYVHNIIESTGEPEITATGKFRKARSGGNSPLAIDLYFDKLSSGDVSSSDSASPAKTEELPKPVISGMSLAEEYAAKVQKEYGLGVVFIDGDSIMFTNENRKLCSNVRAYDTYDQFVKGLATGGIIGLPL